jgi:biopolymer transport protein ExbD
MKIRKTKTLEAVIPTASMADIAFLLIVFFMISTVFQVDRTSVDLPESSKETRSEVIKNSAFVVVHDQNIKASDGVEDSQLVKLEDVGVLASTWMQKNPNQPVVIKADAEATYGLIDDVLEHLRNAGVTNLKFLTEQSKNE